MKKLFFPIWAIMFLCNSCNNRTVTIRDEQGIEHTARVAPIAYYNQYLPVGPKITIMKPKGWLSYVVTEPIYNFCWEKKDSTEIFGLVQREIISGKITAVN